MLKNTVCSMRYAIFIPSFHRWPVPFLIHNQPPDAL